MADFIYEGMRRIAYGDECATFIPVCPHCGRFVKEDDAIRLNDVGLVDRPNATCAKCGRINMPFEGFF